MCKDPKSKQLENNLLLQTKGAILSMIAAAAHNDMLTKSSEKSDPMHT